MDSISQWPTSVNLELTTMCPMGCPFCYCQFDSGRHMDLPVALYWISEAAKCGVTTVSLSGGEAACYPYLEEVVKAAHERCGYVALALSGYGLTASKISSLANAGVDAFHLSLNGSTEEINAQTRNGYAYAMEALEAFSKLKIQNVIINSVLTQGNANDFPNIIRLAEQYGVEGISVLSQKPDSKKGLAHRPRREQVHQIAQWIVNYKGRLMISVESCYSELVVLVYQKANNSWIYGEQTMGCRAGRYTFSVSVDGKLIPCRHLLTYESYGTLNEYWQSSQVLALLRRLAKEPGSGCAACAHGDICRPCVAIRKDIGGSWFAPQPCLMRSNRARR